MASFLCARLVVGGILLRLAANNQLKKKTKARPETLPSGP
jgi:hypothetical protein